MRNIILLLLGILFFTSCEKKIKVDLNDAEPKIVIEGLVTDRPGPYEVKITKSTSFFSPNSFPGVSDAAVTLSDNMGNTEVLTHTGNGVYKTSALVGTPGRTYSLSVFHEGKTYEASATMPQPANLFGLIGLYDSIGVVEKGYYVGASWYDAVGKGNYYRLKIYKNGSMTDNEKKSYMLRDDKYTDGQLMGTLFISSVFQVGDTAKVELITVDEGSYNYYETLVSTLNNNSSQVPPDNPVSNISNKALGYFGAQAITSTSLIIQ